MSQVLCQKLSLFYQSDRVALAWAEGHYLKCIAFWQFFSKLELQDGLGLKPNQNHGRGSLDFDDEIVLPTPSNENKLYPLHQRYSQSIQVPHLAPYPYEKEKKRSVPYTLKEKENFRGEKKKKDAMRRIRQLVTPTLRSRKAKPLVASQPSPNSTVWTELSSWR